MIVQYVHIFSIAKLLSLDVETNGWKKKDAATTSNSHPTRIHKPEPLPPVPSVSATSQNWWHPPSVAPRPFPAECAPRSASPPRHSDGWAPGRAPHAHLHPLGKGWRKSRDWNGENLWKPWGFIWSKPPNMDLNNIFTMIYPAIVKGLDHKLWKDTIQWIKQKLWKETIQYSGFSFVCLLTNSETKPFHIPQSCWLIERHFFHVAWSIIFIHPVWSYIPTKPPCQAQIDHQISLVNLPRECWWSFMGISPSSPQYFLMPKSPLFIASSRLNHG